MKQSEDKKNYAKQDSYALAFALINGGIRHAYPLEAIVAEESILADRLWSVINAKKTKGGKRETLGKALKTWKDYKDGGYSENPFDEEMDSLLPDLTNWWSRRNILVHGIVKSFRGEAPGIRAQNFIRSAMRTAKKGLELATQVSNWSKKFKRRAGKSDS